MAAAAPDNSLCAHSQVLVTELPHVHQLRNSTGTEIRAGTRPNIYLCNGKCLLRLAMEWCCHEPLLLDKQCMTHTKSDGSASKFRLPNHFQQTLNLMLHHPSPEGKFYPNMFART